VPIGKYGLSTEHDFVGSRPSETSPRGNISVSFLKGHLLHGCEREVEDIK
jgi:hypothetical protein